MRVLKQKVSKETARVNADWIMPHGIILGVQIDEVCQPTIDGQEWIPSLNPEENTHYQITWIYDTLKDELEKGALGRYLTEETKMYYDYNCNYPNWLNKKEIRK